MSKVEELLGNTGNPKTEMQEIQESVQQAGFLPEELDLRMDSPRQFMGDLEYHLSDVEGSLNLPSKAAISQAESAQELINSLLP